MNQVELALKGLLSNETQMVTEKIDARYLTDTLGRLKGQADAVVFPQSAEEVAKIMRFAYEHTLPVTPRGAGTNLVGSTVPQNGGIVLDLSKMNHILELDPDTLTVTVEPGVLLKDLQKYVEDHALFYPPDPGEKKATIGGNISTNAGGMRAVKYGVTRDYVRGLEAVLPNGKILSFGGKDVKDASGLSIKNLLIGSEGTLAVLTKCILRLLPKPTVSLSVLVPFGSLKTGIETVIHLLHQNANPTAVEFMERKVVALGEEFLQVAYPRPDAAAYILMTFDGTSEAEVKANVEKVRKSALSCGALDFVLLEDAKRIEEIWKVRGALVKAVEAVSEQEPIDIVVPINRTAEFIAYVNELDAQSGVHMISFGHAGDGNVHLCIIRGDRDEATWKKDLHHVMTCIYQKSHDLGGLPSGEHGIGIAKKPYFKQTMPPENLELMRRIKQAFDERGILNKGKTYQI
ncbi:MAG TPA: 2-hydroxy-acid oxidase [Ruminococcaceae bacterium]|nr:2-hydroxy-acid oxidase [Oscillospiraceae bacterium]